MTTISLTDLENAKRDADDLGTIVNGSNAVTVTTRLGSNVDSISKTLLSAQNAITAHVADIDAYRITAQAAMTDDINNVDAAKTSSIAIIQSYENDVLSDKNSAISLISSYENSFLDDRNTALTQYTAYNNTGAWQTATSYLINDIWEDLGTYYLVLANYTSGANAAADIAGGNVVIHQPKDWLTGFDGNRYGISTSNSGADNTAKINALSLSGKTMWLDGGVYNISSAFIFENNFKLLSKDGNPIRLKSSSFPVISVASGQVDNIEFHGELETTAVDSATDEFGLFDCRSTGSSKNWDLRNIKFYTRNAKVNGIKLIASSSANTIKRNFENINIDGQEYVECGRMGFEVINQGSTTITNISVASEAVFTYTGSEVSVGDLVFIENIIGTGEIDKINLQDELQPNIYRVKEAGTGTFKLTIEGSTVNTTGGTYTSGGDVRVYRYSGIKGRVIARETGIIASNRGMGVSLDGYGWGNNIEAVGYDNALCAIENIGSSWSNFKIIGSGSKEPISSSNTRRKFSNKYTIKGHWGGRAFFETEINPIITSDSNCYLKSDMIFKNSPNVLIEDGANIEGGTNYGVIFENSKNVKVAGTISNKNATSPFAVVRFFGSQSFGGIINGTLIKASSGNYFDEVSSAYDNQAILHRQEQDVIGSVLPNGINLYNERVNPVGTTSTCTITFANTGSWRPTFVEILCSASTTGGGNRGAAKTIVGLAHLGSGVTQETQRTDVMTNANCVISIAYGTNTMIITCTVVSGTPVNWGISVCDFTGKPQSLVFA